MRTTIYIPDELVDGVKEAAWKSKSSVSKYFLDLHMMNISPIIIPGEKVRIETPNAKSQTGYPRENPFEPEKIIEVAKKQEKELSVRAKYKLKFPNQLCPQCKEKNKDCGCEQ